MHLACVTPLADVASLTPEDRQVNEVLIQSEASISQCKPIRALCFSEDLVGKLKIDPNVT